VDGWWEGVMGILIEYVERTGCSGTCMGSCLFREKFASRCNHFPAVTKHTRAFGQGFATTHGKVIKLSIQKADLIYNDQI
jgi:hypothetical protein